MKKSVALVRPPKVQYKYRTVTKYLNEKIVKYSKDGSCSNPFFSSRSVTTFEKFQVKLSNAETLALQYEIYKFFEILSPIDFM